MAKNLSKNRRPRVKPSRDVGEEALWIYGVNPVWECLKAHPKDVMEIYCSRDDPRAQVVLQLAQAHNIPVSVMERRDLSNLLGHGHHQGLAARLKTFRYEALETLLTRLEAHKRPLLVLDGLQDPHNLGAIVRSACFLGAHAVILPKDRSVPVTGAVFKASAGALAHLLVVQVTNLVRAMEQLKSVGYWMVGLDVQGSLSIYDLEYTMPVGLVVGSEGTGLRPLVKKTCDFLVKIPGTGPVQSLNASVATAVALAEIRRQQQLCFNASLRP
ncbi:23S rRNA (guanosine(2251)-2'-O)-methyltransferase RlmB [Desulfosoma caldarium]|uniref:23S rRNA (Guanosine2251-2'-O)-methyltransferase n=1 Tax=Desulfosoma caldarium TaxID=610254 RepID=A0A3N1VI94_9BACT|nr:23S rRNA (guanosine(2251)-2'-O)-methyltransferase RlmB [Desulfosoma caldarium]ROR01759.1 23S rRNA (guanosine2251-2'-O)-methyltransferase [Desulfosoma caldarium]